MKLPKFPKFAEVRKLAAAVLGFAAEAVASGLLSGTALHVAQIVLAVATVAGVYVAPNAKALTDVHATVPLPVVPPATPPVVQPPSAP